MRNIRLAAAVSLLTLAACARTEPVSEAELDEIDVAAPPGSDLEVSDDNPEALPVSAMSWTVQGERATYGDDPSEPALELACDEDGGGLLLTRYGVEGAGSAGTIAVVGNGVSASIPVVAAEAPQEGEFNWTSTLGAGDLAQSVRTAFQADEPVNISGTSVEPLIVTPVPALRSLLSDCLAAAGGEGGDEASSDGAAATQNVSD